MYFLKLVMSFLSFIILCVIITSVYIYLEESKKTNLCKILEKEFNIIYNVYEYNNMFCKQTICISPYLYRKDYFNNLQEITLSDTTLECTKNIYEKLRIQKEYESYKMEVKQ
ncbi:MAG TPA: hypothetical protein VI911_09425 [Patescibacteria group bacterium]|nr:MAG: hypothetical protein UR43_C0005G0133 [candidate division TM6 bacterium GW2011_GWF2_33_332]HLD91218.1 hypothetical protein [Patescibacteria group bacterium]